MNIQQLNTQELLENWYLDQKRDLPWRKCRDPYRIWISETMLQQTTCTAVIPYFERFLERFPTVDSLAEARLPDVLSLWQGLGYYSRARNLHKSARILAKKMEFPRSHRELMQLPGFGPYTARAVSSLAFSEPVGVLDGNVIRVLSRFYNLRCEWWRPRVRAELQTKVDEFVHNRPVHVLNQALMELGSQVCTSQNPRCVMCPIVSQCEARKKSTWQNLPLKKPRRAREMWEWRPRVETKGSRVRLATNDYAPFLRGSWLLPGHARRLKRAPKTFDFRHSVTHYDIYVTVKRKAAQTKVSDQSKWVPAQDVKSVAPYSLVKKALVACGLALVVSACQSTKSTSTSTAVILEKVGPYTLLSQFGVNDAPRFSADGRHLLYVSSKRLSHSNPQLYDRDLKTNLEHRLTFQDGEIFDGIYDHTGTGIIYSSSTDEIKENPRYITDAIKNFASNTAANSATLASTRASTPHSPKDFWGDKLPPTDLYHVVIDGSTIQRMTKAYEFHGEISADPKSNEIVYAAVTGGRTELFRMNVKSHSEQPFLKTTAPAPNAVSPASTPPVPSDEWPQYSPDGKHVVWVRAVAPQKSEIWMADANGANAHKVIGGDAVYWTPSWSPSSDAILFSSNRTTPLVFELYALKSDGTCIQQLTKNSDLGKKNFRLWQAEVSPDLNEIVFTSDISGEPQIYKWQFNDDTRALITHPTCSPTACAKPPCATPSPAVPLSK